MQFELKELVLLLLLQLVSDMCTAFVLISAIALQSNSWMNNTSMGCS